MALVTLCPGCGTTYKIYPEQLQIQNGLVRCGKCQVVFNGFSTLITIDESEIEYLTTSVDKTNNLVESEKSQELIDNEWDPSYSELPTAINVEPLDDIEDNVSQQVEAANAIEPNQAAIDLESTTITDDFLSDTGPRFSLFDKLWLGGCIILILVLIGQGIYIFRADLVARMPQARPLLERYCNILNCVVPLPKHIELFSIVSSDLQVKDSVTQDKVTVLTAVIRNHAAYAQDLPALKLFLTDRDNQLLASRIFTAANYLSEVDKEKTAIYPNQEIIIQLYLDNNHLDPTGYRLQIIFI